MIVKAFLIVSVLAVVLYLLRGSNAGRHLAVRRLAGLGFACCWVVAVLAPDVVTAVANVMGVGRGTDLVLYILVVSFVFMGVAQHQHMRDVDERLAQLTRELTLRNTLPGDPVRVSPVGSRPVDDAQRRNSTDD